MKKIEERIKPDVKNMMTEFASIFRPMKAHMSAEQICDMIDMMRVYTERCIITGMIRQLKDSKPETGYNL